MCEVGMLSFNAWDLHHSEDGVNVLWVKDHLGG
jgi:hypothetical protein